MGNEQVKQVENYRYPSGNTYTGEMVGNNRQGTGTLHWTDGATYSGSWNDDLCQGAGVMKFPNGSVYEGNFVRNNPHGQGKLTTINQEVVLGFWEFQGRSDRVSEPVGKYFFQGELIDLKTGEKTVLSCQLALYLRSGLVSLPQMQDPMQALFPYAVVESSKGESNAPIATAVQYAATSSNSISYGQHEPALQPRHPDDHPSFSLLDPRLYLSSLGIGPAPANTNARRQNDIRNQEFIPQNPAPNVVVAVPVQPKQ